MKSKKGNVLMGSADCKMFYVYQHRRKDNNEVFYIGKRHSGRAYSAKGRNDLWHATCAEANGYNVEIIFTCDDEDVILAYERFLIKTAVIWGDDLANKTYGGEGKSGILRTEEEKEHLRRINTGKRHSEATINKIKDLHKNPTWIANHKKRTLIGSNSEKARQKHHEKQKVQYKPVLGTNIETGEKLLLGFTSQDSRFNPSLIRRCCIGERKQHKGYAWQYLSYDLKYLSTR